MSFLFDERDSDSPLIETIWRTQSAYPVQFMSQAESHWEMVICTYQGETILTVRGPETHASPAEGPAGAEYLGIVFKLGAFMPHLPLKNLIDRQDHNLLPAGSNSFWLYGKAWQYPTYENADTFISQLIRTSILQFDPIVEAVLQDKPLDLSLRTVQRRFVQSTGMTLKTIQQIDRARLATALLIQGKPIADTALEMGYYDQSHLTNSLNRFMGQTPVQLVDQSDTE